MKCPVCDSTKKVALTKGEKTISVRGEPIVVPIEFYKCSTCGEEALVPGDANDPFLKAYRLFRDRHHMLQPEEILAFRRKFDLTQEELARLLGLGGATLSRYENGSLQDKTHDTLLRMVVDPENLRALVSDSTNVLSEDKRRQLLSVIDGMRLSEGGLFARAAAAAFEHSEADEYSGFKAFDNERFLNAVLYFCKEGAFKTKVNKLLFYSDFKHFKQYNVSITGARYARVPFGPAPDGYDLYFSMLARQGAMEIEEVVYPEYMGEEYTAKQEPNLNVFSDSELRVLALVKEQFRDYSARAMSEFSHAEKGYRDTATGRLIAYSYARELRI